MNGSSKGVDYGAAEDGDEDESSRGKARNKSSSKKSKHDSGVSRGGGEEEVGTAAAQESAGERDKGAKAGKGRKSGGGLIIKISRGEDEMVGEAGAEGERKRDKSKGKSAGGGGTGDEMDVEEEAEKRSKSKKRKREEVDMEEGDDDEEACEDEADEDGGGWDNCVTNYTEEIGRLHGIYKQFKVGGGAAVGCMRRWPCGGWWGAKIRPKLQAGYVRKWALDTDPLARGVARVGHCAGLIHQARPRATLSRNSGSDATTVSWHSCVQADCIRVAVLTAAFSRRAIYDSISGPLGKLSGVFSVLRGCSASHVERRPRALWR